ncbi:MAG: class I SAM-dependent methyltransferase [Actinomycetota bacterium]|nr:class I SAM-dependent methyltransferase [Actinomycetota bacterium]
MDKKPKFQESQYDACLEIEDDIGRTSLGIMRNHDWSVDPRRFAFTFSRYKFVSKMFEGFDQVLEIGCGDAFATRIVQQSVKHVTAIDFDPMFIDDIKKRLDLKWPLEAIVHDILSEPMNNQFDGVFSLDVLEHIDESNDNTFLKNVCKSLKEHGTFIVGMPSLESQVYASVASKIGHVNCKSGPDLRDLLKKYFHSVFMFSMNDEVLHTGFFPMSHYLLAVCCDKK